MSEEEKKLFEAIKYKNKHLFLVKVDADFLINLIENQQKELNNLKEIEKSHKEENGKLRVELEQEKARNEKLQYKIDEKELIIDGMKEERRIAIEEIREEYYISKDKIKDFVSEKMKHLYVDSCAEDSGKYTAYKNILNLLGEK